jgi:hypothetical protein
VVLAVDLQLAVVVLADYSMGLVSVLIQHSLLQLVLVHQLLLVLLQELMEIHLHLAQ